MRRHDVNESMKLITYGVHDGTLQILYRVLRHLFERAHVCVRVHVCTDMG